MINLRQTRAAAVTSTSEDNLCGFAIFVRGSTAPGHTEMSGAGTRKRRIRRRIDGMVGRKTLYLANPYGFSAQQKAGPLQDIVCALQAVGAEVWEPFERNNQIDKMAPGWAYRVGQADVRDVRESDGVFAIVNGSPPDEGVMVEIGLAIAWSKPVFLFRDDFRRCADSDDYPLNLMVFAGLPETGWRDYWYESVPEISEPRKALMRWLNDGAL